MEKLTGMAVVAVVVCAGLIGCSKKEETPSSPPAAAPAAAPATENVNLREATDSFQREAISRALEANQRNWAATARALELDVANLHRLAKRLGLKG